MRNLHGGVLLIGTMADIQAADVRVVGQFESSRPAISVSDQT
jgi:hypothetical protein